MTRSEAKVTIDEMRKSFDLGTKYMLALRCYETNDYGFQIYIKQEELLMGEGYQYNDFFNTRDPEKLERMLSLICKRR